MKTASKSSGPPLGCPSTKDRVIKSLPAIIRRPGHYCLKSNLSFNAKLSGGGGGGRESCKPVKPTTVAISVQASGVTIDGRNHWIDMQGGAGTGVKMDGVEGVQILNLNFRNSGNPGDVPTAGAVPEIALFEPPSLAVSTAQSCEQLTLELMVEVYPCSFTWVNAVDPYSGVGIAIHQSTGILIENCNFTSMFIGIAGVSISTDPTNLDISRDIVIRGCTGSECGFVKPDAAYCSEFGIPPQQLRGAFIAFQGASFLGPTQSAPFYCGAIDIVTGVVDNTALYPFVFQGITIQNCQAASQIALAGIFLNYTNSCTVENCTMSLYANSVPIPDELNADGSAPFSGQLQSCAKDQELHWTGWIQHILLPGGHEYYGGRLYGADHYNTGMQFLFEQYAVVRNCSVSEGLDLGLPVSFTGGIPTILFGVGYVLQMLCAYQCLVESVTGSNYRTVSQVQTSTKVYSQYNNYQDAIGVCMVLVFLLYHPQ